MQCTVDITGHNAKKSPICLLATLPFRIRLAPLLVVNRLVLSLGLALGPGHLGTPLVSWSSHSSVLVGVISWLSLGSQLRGDRLSHWVNLGLLRSRVVGLRLLGVLRPSLGIPSIWIALTVIGSLLRVGLPWLLGIIGLLRLRVIWLGLRLGLGLGIGLRGWGWSWLGIGLWGISLGLSWVVWLRIRLVGLSWLNWLCRLNRLNWLRRLNWLSRLGRLSWLYSRLRFRFRTGSWCSPERLIDAHMGRQRRQCSTHGASKAGLDLSVEDTD